MERHSERRFVTPIDPDQLEAWRAEITAEIVEAGHQLAEARAGLAEAQENRRVATDRRQAADAAGLSFRGSIASSLLARLDPLSRPERAAIGRVSLMTQVVANAVRRLSDLEVALNQIERLAAGTEPEPEQTGIIRS